MVCVGSLKGAMKDIENEYLKRMRDVDVVEVKEEKDKGLGVDKILKNEEKRILDKLRGFVVVLDEKGKEMNSNEFARFVNERRLGGDITFVVGGPYGLSQNIKNRADIILSLSRLTLTHEMARILLLEQLYRTFTKSIGYHK